MNYDITYYNSDSVYVPIPTMTRILLGTMVTQTVIHSKLCQNWTQTVNPKTDPQSKYIEKTLCDQLIPTVTTVEPKTIIHKHRKQREGINRDYKTCCVAKFEIEPNLSWVGLLNFCFFLGGRSPSLPSFSNADFVALAVL